MAKRQTAKPRNAPRLVSIDDRELSTLLAALRNWQQTYHKPLEIEEIATNGGECDPLDNDEIDALCIRINCGE